MSKDNLVPSEEDDKQHLEDKVSESWLKRNTYLKFKQVEWDNKKSVKSFLKSTTLVSFLMKYDDKNLNHLRQHTLATDLDKKSVELIHKKLKVLLEKEH
jgi:hypothetical protein